MTRRQLILSASAAALAFGKTKPTVGCQANGFVLKPGDFPGLLDAVGKMKALNYAGFECNVRFVRDQFERSAQARGEIERTGVEFLGGHMSIQDATPEIFRGLASLGAHWAVISSSGPWRGEDLDALAKTCASQGLKFAYHNHNPEFANGNAVIEELAKTTKVASFLMDAGHGYLGGGNPAEFMRHHAGRIVGCHIKTFKGSTAKGQVALGQGDFGFENLAAAINETGWSGWLIDEEGGGPTPANTAALGPDREYIRRVFGT
jgi:sugar phosphate isomerase/epimerase